MCRFIWAENKKLINNLSDLSQERCNKIKNLEMEFTFESLNDEILKLENPDLMELWKKYNKLNEFQ